MKKFIIRFFVLFAVVMICGMSCRKADDDPSNAGLISQFDSDKILVSTVVGSTATGFGAIFENLIIDSLARVEFCRVYTDSIRYFEDLSGYFFTQDFFGWNVAYPTNKDLEGTYLWDLQDPEGNFFIRTMSEIAKTAGSGFIEYYWNNPATGDNEKKLSFIHTIPGIEYYIGSGFYIRSTDPTITLLESNKEISKNATISFVEGIAAVFVDIYTDSLDRVQFCRTLLDTIKFFEDNSGYFFVVDLNGYCISHGANKNLEGTDVYDLQDSKGVFFIREMIALAENPGYGFFEYYWNNPASGLDEKKMTYIRLIPGTDYLIGAGVYVQ